MAILLTAVIVILVVSVSNVVLLLPFFIFNDGNAGVEPQKAKMINT